MAQNKKKADAIRFVNIIKKLSEELSVEYDKIGDTRHNGSEKNRNKIWILKATDIITKKLETQFINQVIKEKGYCDTLSLFDEKDAFIERYSKALVDTPNTELGFLESDDNISDPDQHIRGTVTVFREYGKTLGDDEYEHIDNNTPPAKDESFEDAPKENLQKSLMKS